MNKKLNSNLHKAKKEKNDEFYTQLVDIEKELKNYTEHFKDKVVYCNCDNPEWSNFWLYFSNNFNHLGLKKVISTHFERDKPSYKLEMNNQGETIRTALTQNGDFRSSECIEFLKEADIVVTNPPFSLFREYIAQLVDYDKKFLVIGNLNSITYKEIFKLIKENKLWLGIHNNKTMEFQLSDSYQQYNRIDEKTGKKFGNVPAISWYTNLTHNKRNQEIILFKQYEGNEANYPKYDNYDAIEVSKVNEIPVDYEGVMGVPITFLDKFNPNQFEIIKFRKGNDEKDLSINGKCPYFRVLIKRKQNENRIERNSS